MCAVIGYYSTNPTDDDLADLKALFHESSIRGLHAFGFATRKHGEVYKDNDLECTLEYLERSWPFKEMIGHCRYSTSGDYKVVENNQPLSWDYDRLVFNGVIHMGTKEEMEKEAEAELPGDNDGFIFLHYARSNVRLDTWVANSPFSFAGLYMDKKTTWAIRNENRPLWIWKRGDSVFIASTKDIFQRVIGVEAKPTQFQVGELVDISKC